MVPGNHFGYMMEHYDIDGLVEYGSDEIPGATRIVNPVWRDLDRQINRLNTRLRSHQAKLGAATPLDGKLFVRVEATPLP